VNGNDTGGTQISSREILTVIFRRRIPILVCALIVTAAALSAASRAKSVYDATAKVLIRRQGATALSTTWTPFYGLEEEMNTEVEIIISEPVLERAIGILNAKGVAFVEAKKKKKIARPPTVDDLAGGVSADPIEKSNILLIKFRGTQPGFAADAANAIADAYVEFRVQVRKTGGLDNYFQDQISDLENRLLDLSMDELKLRMEGGVYDREWQQRITLNRQSEIQLKLNEVRGRRIGEEGKLAAVKNRLKQDPGVLWPFPIDSDDHFATLMLTEYWTLERDRDGAAAQFTAINPQVVMMNERLARMEGRLRDEARRRMAEKEYLIQDLKADEVAYSGEITTIGQELSMNPEVVSRIEYLQKQIQYTYMHYDKVLEKMLDTMASEADDIRISNAKVLSPAEVRLTKAGQMQAVYVMFSILLGVTLGIGLGFLLENLDHSVKSASDVEDIVGVPLLGSIPETGRVSASQLRMDDSADRTSQ